MRAYFGLSLLLLALGGTGCVVEKFENCGTKTDASTCAATKDASTAPYLRSCVWNDTISSCVSDHECAANDIKAKCDAATEPNGGGSCVWYMDRCGVANSQTDPVPADVACADVADEDSCNLHSFNGTKCWYQDGACGEVAACSDLTSQAACDDETVFPGTQGCFWNGTACTDPVSPACAVNDCSQFSTWFSDNSAACEAAAADNGVTSVAVCEWTPGNFFGGTCSNIDTGTGTACQDPAMVDQATCEGNGNFCTWYGAIMAH